MKAGERADSSAIRLKYHSSSTVHEEPLSIPIQDVMKSLNANFSGGRKKGQNYYC